VRMMGEVRKEQERVRVGDRSRGLDAAIEEKMVKSFGVSSRKGDVEGSVGKTS